MKDGEKLEKNLKKLGISKNKLSELMNVARPNIIQYTRSIKFSDDVMNKILQALKITKDEFDNIGYYEFEDIKPIIASEPTGGELLNYFMSTNKTLINQIDKLNDTINRLSFLLTNKSSYNEKKHYHVDADSFDVL